RDKLVTGVQTCALPISVPMVSPEDHAAVRNERERIEALVGQLTALKLDLPTTLVQASERLSEAAAKLGGRVYQAASAPAGISRRSEERRVGKECRVGRW